MNPVKRIWHKFKRETGSHRARVYHGISSVRRKAHPIYYMFRSFFRLVLHTQHTEIQAIGLENIPSDGSVMLVGNHPNSYLDYLHLLNAVRHPVASAAKDVITNWPFLGQLLRQYMMLIPIARRQDQDITGSTEEERRQANAEAVRETVELLVQGRLYNIFGEGRSTDSRKLNKIKLGFMHIALQAEREFNYKLNLRIVPFGFFYDRINKFQSSAVIIFGKPFKLNNLDKIPDNFLSLSLSEQIKVEKKLLVRGKERMQREIESIIISISDRDLISLIDDATALYVLTPSKFMGAYKNIREKYHLSKMLADCFQKASLTTAGRTRLEELKLKLDTYRKELKRLRLVDGLVRREHGWAEFGFHLGAVLRSLINLPFIIYGKLFNFLPHRMGRLARYYTIKVKKKPKVDGDESALIAAIITAFSTYPVFGALLGCLIYVYGLPWLLAWTTAFCATHGFAWLAGFVAALQGYLALLTVGLALLSIYLMARLWRVANRHFMGLRAAALWLRDSVIEITRQRDVELVRQQRYEILDCIDFIIGEYDSDE